MLQPPMRKMEPSPKMVVIFGLCFLYVQILMSIFLFESKILCIKTRIELYSWVTTLILIESALSLAFFLFSYLRDPGYIQPELDFIRLLEVYEDLGQLCPEC